MSVVIENSKSDEAAYAAAGRLRLLRRNDNRKKLRGRLLSVAQFWLFKQERYGSREYGGT